jgi:uncharacterized protein (DUF433 family)
MSRTATDYKYIELDDDGIAIIADSTMKVSELISHHLAYGWSPEELHFQFPHIALSQIYSALAYYWDFKDTLDTEMQHRLALVEAMRQSAPPSRIVQKLRESGALE